MTPEEQLELLAVETWWQRYAYLSARAEAAGIAGPIQEAARTAAISTPAETPDPVPPPVAPITPRERVLAAIAARKGGK